MSYSSNRMLKIPFFRGSEHWIRIYKTTPSTVNTRYRYIKMLSYLRRFDFFPRLPDLDLRSPRDLDLKG